MYGSLDSLLRMRTFAVGSLLRIVRQAENPAVPPPMIKYGMCSGRFGIKTGSCGIFSGIFSGSDCGFCKEFESVPSIVSKYRQYSRTYSTKKVNSHSTAKQRQTSVFPGWVVPWLSVERSSEVETWTMMQRLEILPQPPLPSLANGSAWTWLKTLDYYRITDKRCTFWRWTNGG